MPEEKYGPRPLYGVTIHHAAAGGNLAEMKKVAAEAEAHLKDHGDVSAALQVLKVEIAKHEKEGQIAMAADYPSRPIIPLYGVTIHNAAASGDLAEMKKVAAEAEEYLNAHGDVSGALQALKVEIAKLEPKH